MIIRRQNCWLLLSPPSSSTFGNLREEIPWGEEYQLATLVVLLGFTEAKIEFELLQANELQRLFEEEARLKHENQYQYQYQRDGKFPIRKA